VDTNFIKMPEMTTDALVTDMIQERMLAAPMMKLTMAAVTAESMRTLGRSFTLTSR
jgi:hypothetical protein